MKEPNGILELSSESLGNCSNYHIGSEVKSVSLKKVGHDTWFGEYVAVETSSEVRFCTINERTRTIRYTYDHCILARLGKLEFLPKFSDKKLDRGDARQTKFMMKLFT